MSSHSFPKINQKEYLKKYLSGHEGKKKKKHKKSCKVSAKVKIIDDDLNHLDTGPEIDEELLLTGEDAPQIVGEYIVDSPADQKVPKWKTIVIKDEPEESELHPARNDEEGIWGRKTGDVRIKQEFSSGAKRTNRTPDNSPQRRKDRRRKCSSSPPRSLRKSPSITRASKGDQRPKIKTEPLSPLHENYTKNKSRASVNASSSRDRKNSDQSPPRRKQSSSSRDIRKGHSLPSDNSPRRRRRSSPDQSPPRKHKDSECRSAARTRYGSDGSTSRGRSPPQSPPRRRQNTDELSQYRHRRGSDQSPPRRKRYSCDVSPTRRSRQSAEKPDNSPPRKCRKATDPSPPSRRRNPDQSPPRRKRKPSTDTRVKQEKRTPDLSPRPARHSRWEKQESEKSPSPPPTHKPKPGKTLEGKKAGLQSAQALQKETKERHKKEDHLFETMSADISGRNAEVQVRSTGRKGRRAREAAEEDPEERRRKDEYEEKKKQQYDRWGKGLKQIEDHRDRMLQQEYESSKPLARYANDADLEQHLRDQERAEDPMLEYMRQKRKDKEKESGKPEMPCYKGSYPENRFGIRPGYRWDGVDRSNGYEKKYFAVQNEKQARQDEAYKYSVEDM